MNESQEPQRTLKVFIKGDKLHLISEEILSLEDAQKLQGQLSEGIISIFRNRFFKSKD